MLWSGCCWRIAVDLRKLEQQFGRWSVASGRPALFQGPNLCEGNLLWRWGLGVWRGRLGLVPTGGAARAWTWTARRPCIQDDPTSCKDDIKESEVLELRLWFEFDLEPQLNNAQKWLMELGMRVSTETYQLNSCLGCDVMLHILWRLQNSSEDLQHPERNRGNDALKRIKCALKILRLPGNQTSRSTKLILIYFINIPIYFCFVKKQICLYLFFCFGPTPLSERALPSHRCGWEETRPHVSVGSVASSAPIIASLPWRHAQRQLTERHLTAASHGWTPDTVPVRAKSAVSCRKTQQSKVKAAFINTCTPGRLLCMQSAASAGHARPAVKECESRFCK